MSNQFTKEYQRHQRNLTAARAALTAAKAGIEALSLEIPDKLTIAPNFAPDLRFTIRAKGHLTIAEARQLAIWIRDATKNLTPADTTSQSSGV